MVERNAGYELARTQRFADRNNQAMLDLADVLDLPDLPHRIEGYDISHIQGSDAVASQVVFIDGLPAKQHYRHYKIKNPTVRSGHSDDFASMAEVIQRRFRKYDKSKAIAEDSKPPEATLKPKPDADFPDLVMIDGGKGQLSAVVEVLRQMNLLEDVKVVSLAKQREEIFLPRRVCAAHHHGRTARSPAFTPPPRRSPPICRQLPSTAAQRSNEAIAPGRNSRTRTLSPEAALGALPIDRLFTGSFRETNRGSPWHR